MQEFITETVSHYNDVVDDETRIACLAKECGVITRAEVEARLVSVRRRQRGFYAK